MKSKVVALFFFTLLLVSLVKEADCIDYRKRRGKGKRERTKVKKIIIIFAIVDCSYG